MYRSIKLDDETYDILEQIAASETRSTASLIRHLLATHPAIIGYRKFKEKGMILEIPITRSTKPKASRFKTPSIDTKGVETYDLPPEAE